MAFRRYKQIGAEAARGYLGGEVRVGGGEHAHIDLDGSRRPDPFQFAGLQNTQQPGLLGLADVGDFVKEERAAVGEFEAADAVGSGIGKGSAHMAEKLALENAFGNPPALTATRRRPLRCETACSVCATTSFPVPGSPVINMLASEGPTSPTIPGPAS